MELKREITCINKKFVIFSLNVFLTRKIRLCRRWLKKRSRAKMKHPKMKKATLNRCT